jgi:hypothetical protein
MGEKEVGTVKKTLNVNHIFITYEMSDSDQPETKTYLWTNETKTTFPPEFIASRNKRYIIVEQCKAVLNDELVGDVIMHADFIERNPFLDHSCCFVNEQPNKDTAKYEYKGYKRYFKVWFTNMKQELIEPEMFTLRLLLIY